MQATIVFYYGNKPIDSSTIPFDFNKLLNSRMLVMDKIYDMLSKVAEQTAKAQNLAPDVFKSNVLSVYGHTAQYITHDILVALQKANKTNIFPPISFKGKTAIITAEGDKDSQVYFEISLVP